MPADFACHVIEWAELEEACVLFAVRRKTAKKGDLKPQA